MAKITLQTITEIETEYAKWAEFLNVGVGLLSFNLGISCLGTPSPSISASLSLVFMFLFLLYGQKHFPRKIRELRKSDLAEMDRLTHIGIEHKYFGIKSLFRYFPVFLAGYLFLGAVCLYGILK